MANSKRIYSKLAEYYNGFVVPNSIDDKRRYEKNKERERKYNERWKQHKVNLNELVNRYTPGATPKIKGVKAIFDGDRYKIIADLPSGYAKVQDKTTKKKKISIFSFMIHPIRHFITIIKHRNEVIRLCFKAGIRFQGLFLDLSKYTPTEFIPGCIYYTGKESQEHRPRKNGRIHLQEVALPFNHACGKR